MYVANGLVNQTLISVYGLKRPAEMSGELSIPFSFKNNNKDFVYC